MNVAVLCGGVGAARLLRGLAAEVPAQHLSAIVNVGDDAELHGLYVCPDIDTILYTVADEIDPKRGWGRVDETWRAMHQLERLGGEIWFSLGDSDLGTHLYRTGRLRQGATLQTITDDMRISLGIHFSVVPATNSRLKTLLNSPAHGELSFQDYFVRLRHQVEVDAVTFVGADNAEPANGVIEFIEHSDVLVIAPSNPVISIDPILSIKAIRDAVEKHPYTIAVSPLIKGKTIKGPATELMLQLGGEASVVGVANWYEGLIQGLVIDNADAGSGSELEALGVNPFATDTIMSDLAASRRLASAILSWAERGLTA